MLKDVFCCFLGRGTLTLFYTRGLGIVVSHVMVPEPYRVSPLLFKIGMVI
jgi:hypothetical protein